MLDCTESVDLVYVCIGSSSGRPNNCVWAILLVLVNGSVSMNTRLLGLVGTRAHISEGGMRTSINSTVRFCFEFVGDCLCCSSVDLNGPLDAIYS
jgi:hypothetical protein